MEEYFDVSVLDTVSKNLFYYLIQTDSSVPLRKIYFIDLINKNLDLAYREPYFIIVDILDHAKYVKNDWNEITGLTYSSTTTGRGTISIDLDNEGAGTMFYKLRITTLPRFTQWAFDVIKVLTRGVSL